ncbi:DUF4123 domain-containing protein [Tateyamaria sp. SN6-1]|uniref:DUF4123 domain-containing protein n=1 Tax=Tateyamaria sp. SN6-1 TaxID=3092148 RepID=UPI0039F4D020
MALAPDQAGQGTAVFADLFDHADVTGIVPLDTQLGVDAPSCVPDALFPPLFGPDADGTTPQTYAILDAAKLSLLPDMIEAAGCPAACLFQGEAAAQYRDCAPWLVALGPQDKLTRGLMTDCPGPTGLWARELGMFIRCTSSFDALWRHLRRFVRLRQTADDAWFYFRFWERHVPLGLATAQADAPRALMQALLAPVGGAPQRWVICDAITRSADILTLSAPERVTPQAPALHPDTLAALQHSTAHAQMRGELHEAMADLNDAVRAEYQSDTRLVDLWQYLHKTRFTERAQRIEAVRGYLTLAFAHREDTAWRILNTKAQGPKIRLWHLQRAVEAAA